MERDPFQKWCPMTVPTRKGEWGWWDCHRCISIAERPDIARPKVNPIGSDVQKQCPLSRVGVGFVGGIITSLSDKVSHATAKVKSFRNRLLIFQPSLEGKGGGAGGCKRFMSLAERPKVKPPGSDVQ